jgi:hypothetical protein
MKNIQVIDSAVNCTFSIFQATDDEFALLFPESGQAIQFVEDKPLLIGEKNAASALSRIWDRPIRNRDAQGIHGTLFFGLERYKTIYRDRREDGVSREAVNAAQRRLFGM